MVATFGEWLTIELKDASTFKTHMNYVRCMNERFSNCEIVIKSRTSGTLDPKKINKFQKLADITQKSVDNELSFIAQEIEYAQVVAPWLPVKCYYRLYYLESIFLYLLNGNQAVFKQGGHSSVRNSLQIGILDGSFYFKNDELNVVVNLEKAIEYKGTSGANVRNDYYKTSECIKALRKKIGQYKLVNFKDQKVQKNHWRTKKGREEHKKFLNRENIMLPDYFYWMRIKANYKDVDFLDFENIRPTEAVEYIKNYVSAVNKYANALNNAISVIIKDRKI